MKRFSLLFCLLFCFGCYSQLVVKRDKLVVVNEYVILDKMMLYGDTIYRCKDNITIRVSQDTIYYYSKRQYLKVGIVK